METHVAPNEDALRQDLVRRDLHVFEVKQRGGGIPIGKYRIGGGAKRVPRAQFLLFNQEFVTLLRAGLPLLQAIDVLLERMKQGPFRRYLTDIRERVAAGSALSEAFMAQAEAFPRVYAASLTAGERTGELPAVMQRYVDFAKKTERIRSRVTAALMYPTLLTIMSVGLICLLMFYILPRFSTFYSEFDQELPTLTVLLIDFARWLQGNGLYILVLAVASAIAAYAWKRTPAGRLFFDSLKLSIPIAGPVLRKYETSQFARTLATLLSGGIPLVSSLQTTAGAMGNRVFIDATHAIAEEVRQGKALWDSIEKTGAMSDLIIEMVKVGEATGQLASMLGNVAEFYDEQVDESLTRVVSLFEPILLVIMGVVVGVVLLAMYLPIFKLAGAGAPTSQF